ncbi:hypothetical protein FQ154_13650 [Paeniglutamicibacter gangotriensis]|uniref:Uncharacterized protein n=1 Tax=Paeniglutamicibacter gangotriensis TaxID=254787 RepID=A0A5B0E984_9MICC|nr:hypothetical protein [Paeniglutamicibacter gangotriensis]KAA0975248.1 hypothetical protein FQ154_13650 [Paeniglutamicibacter gangotriensis]
MPTWGESATFTQYGHEQSTASTHPGLQRITLNRFSRSLMLFPAQNSRNNGETMNAVIAKLEAMKTTPRHRDTGSHGSALDNRSIPVFRVL